jgi:hypothetical protein
MIDVLVGDADGEDPEPGELPIAPLVVLPIEATAVPRDVIDLTCDELGAPEEIGVDNAVRSKSLSVQLMSKAMRGGLVSRMPSARSITSIGSMRNDRCKTTPRNTGSSLHRS